MTRRKSVCSKWTLVLLVVLVPYVFSRPQETTQSPVLNISSNSVTEKSTENPIRVSSQTTEESRKQDEVTTGPSGNAPRNVKTKAPVIGESIKMVATQLLENPSNVTAEKLDNPIVIDTRIPPKVKNQLAHKHKNKRHEDGEEPSENVHAGEAVPITMEELENENKVHDISNESSTSNEGLSTWILLSNPDKKENVTTEPTKVEEPQKKQKPNNKNKTKRPPNKPAIGKRPIIGSINKSDLVAGGSAINENVLNKIKDTVLSNVQKNKSTTQRTTTVTSTTSTTTAAPTETLSTKKEVPTKSPSTVSIPVKVSTKPSKKKNKNKQKTTTTPATTVNDSALLPMEPKEQEIELEISTPATTTKKPKRSSTRTKTKTKKRKTTKPKPEATTTISEVKNNNKTKSTKTKKPSSSTSLTGPITSQIYTYLSREVMPSVGVGMLGLASLVGIAGYFLYPFSTPVRRTFEVDKKDDIYRHNAEEYASDGNGQAEEEMLGTVLAGMPAHAKHKLNPYAGQTTHANRYPVKKDQDIRYRHVASVATKYEPNYSARYPQQKTGIAHGAVYPEPLNYNQYHYDTRQVYTSESKYLYDKGPSAYTSRPAAVAAPVEPIYAAPQTGPTGISSYGSETSNAVVYGVKPSSDSEFKPVYPYENQFYSSEVTTSSPISYPSTSLYLGSNEESIKQEENDYADNQNSDDENTDNKFVVGNVPKELVESATPAVVPEHGPRNLNRKRRTLRRQKRGISGSIEQILKEEKEKNKDIFISNEIDEALGLNVKKLVEMDEIPMQNNLNVMPIMNNVYPVYSMSIDSTQVAKSSTDAPITTARNDIIESISTVPVETHRQEKTTTESNTVNELETTTKMFKIYEVFSTTNPDQGNSQSFKTESTTQAKGLNTETTTELKSETTSTMPPSPSPVTDFKEPSSAPTSSVMTPKPTNNPEVLTYPPLNQDGGGFFTFLKRLIEFKYRLGLSILQTTSDNLNRYLRSMENTVSKVANASKH